MHLNHSLWYLQLIHEMARVHPSNKDRLVFHSGDKRIICFCVYNIHPLEVLHLPKDEELQPPKRCAVYTSVVVITLEGGLIGVGNNDKMNSPLVCQAVNW